MRLTTPILCAAFLLACLLPLPVSAGENEVIEGRLQAVRMEDKTVVMDGVRVYVPPEIADLGDFSAGDQVVFEYRREEGRLTARLLRKYEEG
jgi:hypothetical protein